jgi:predicted  nucleic acid-binding Zn-ribbon protein
VTDDRALRDALEQAQDRTKTLERQLGDALKVHDALQAELTTLRAALADAARPMPHPGESKELVRLHAQVNALQFELSHLRQEREKLLEATKKR